jgi:Ca2+-transporting ATPase
MLTSSLICANNNQAIARQCGILTRQGKVLEGPEFRAMTPKQLDEVLPKLQVRCVG